MQAHHKATAGVRAPAANAATLSTLPPAYKRQAWLAVAALLAFVIAYAALAGWFLHTGWRLSFGPGGGGTDGFWSFVVAACSTLLAVFMIKAVFFIQRGQPEGLTELTPAQEPELFNFLHELADKAGAPRPHKVYASARVNAAVFYDLSLLNLLMPSRKNLEIGLGLVNVLTLGEMRAVLAHEFGHFAQRSMAVGRWVYVAHQIVANMVARRDKLDAFLDGLSRFDIRFAWVGWILQTIIWSIRSLVATAFQGVMVMQRALSREMEMQADLVAVSLTGSDALVHALLKLQAADDSWERALNMAGGHKLRGRPPRDVFAMQQHVLARMGTILNDPLYGRVPAVPQEAPQAHRVFKAELAQPPRMWLSHPLNHEREANAKRVYVAAPIDERSAWSLFARPDALREQVTALLIGKTDEAPVAVADTLAEIDEAFVRPSLDGRYRGVYLGRSVTRTAHQASELYTVEAASIRDLARLYPATLVHEIEKQRQLERELNQLQALLDGVAQSSNNEIRYRGRALSRKQLPAQIEQVTQELQAVRQALQDHDRLVRSTHMAAAREAGQGWEAYIQGLLAVLHYVDHTEANLVDLQGVVGHTFRVVTATGKVNDKKLQRLLEMCNTLQEALGKVYVQRRLMKLDVKLINKLDTMGWEEYLGDLGLPPADRGNINDWLKVVDGWVNKTASACNALRNAALDELLDTEAMLARHVLEGGPVNAAPAPTVVPTEMDRLPPGQERKPQDKLDWLARIQTADGKAAMVMRLGVAGAIVSSVLLMGGAAGTHHVMVYNGLDTTVTVRLGTREATLSPHAAELLEVEPVPNLHVQARTKDGRLIEAFDAERQNHQVYNVAGASPLMVWTAVYGPATPREPRPLGAERWLTSQADVLFGEPPNSVSTKHGQGATRDVLKGFADLSVGEQLGALADHPKDKDRVIATHAKWDDLTSPNLSSWLVLDAQREPAGEALKQRLAQTPDNVALLRLQQDMAKDEAARAQVCAAQVAQAKAQPANPNWAYMAVRCLPEGPAHEQGFVEGHAKWPEHPWFTYATAYVHAEAGQWQMALDEMKQARGLLPALASDLAEDEGRVLRMLRGPDADISALAPHSRALQMYLSLEREQALQDSTLGPAPKAYAALHKGNFVQGQSYVGSDAEASARWLRLAAASDGAPRDMVDGALKLVFESGLDDVSFWPSLGLALREHADTRPYQRLIERGEVPGMRGTGEQAKRMWQALQAAMQQGPTALTSASLQGLHPQLKGLTYSAAVAALGPRAPQAWRDAANSLLFVVERPYFE